MATDDTIDDEVVDILRYLVDGDRSFKWAKKALANLIAQEANKARIDELKRVLVTYKHWPGNFEDGIYESIRILKNPPQLTADKEPK